jgi:hypothetical protein
MATGEIGRNSEREGLGDEITIIIYDEPAVI